MKNHRNAKTFIINIRVEKVKFPVAPATSGKKIESEKGKRLTGHKETNKQTNCRDLKITVDFSEHCIENHFTGTTGMWLSFHAYVYTLVLSRSNFSKSSQERIKLKC